MIKFVLAMLIGTLALSTAIVMGLDSKFLYCGLAFIVGILSICYAMKQVE